MLIYFRPQLKQLMEIAKLTYSKEFKGTLGASINLALLY
jgi:hypothetical protein